MSRKRFVIAGAGLAGLSAAWHLQKNKIEPLVFEKEPVAGGLCRSKIRGGFIFDYDGHLLHFKSPYVFNLVKSLLRDNLSQHKREAFVYLKSGFSRYPFQANLYGLPDTIAKECLRGFLKVSKNGHRQSKQLNFLEWINRTFGRGIAKYFMIPYNEKFWTVPARELTCEWLDGFIPVPSLREVIAGSVKENRKQFGYNACFFYPKKAGIGQLPLAFSSRIKNIYTDCAIKEINVAQKYIKLASGDKAGFDCLVSTIPLPELPVLIRDLPKGLYQAFQQLRWNSIFNLNLGLDKVDKLKRHWVYFPEKETCFFRVGFPHNFSSALTPDKKSSFYIEVAYSRKRQINKKTIVKNIKDDLRKTGVLGEKDKILVEDVNDIPYGYPIYDHNYQAATKKIFAYLYQNNIIPCGRYGAWQYLSMEGAILDGKRKAQEALCCL